MSVEMHESRGQTIEQPTADPSCAKALACARAAIDKKAEHVKILNLTGISGFTDYFVICSGMSDRQVQAISDSVEFQVEAGGSDVVLRKRTGELACPRCISRIRMRVHPDQQQLIG